MLDINKIDICDIMTKAKTRTEEEDCPICLEKISIGLITQCGHKFCGECILKVLKVCRREKHWRRIGVYKAIPCPCCRQKVMDLIPYLSEEERNKNKAKIVRILWSMEVEVGRFRQSVK